MNKLRSWAAAAALLMSIPAAAAAQAEADRWSLTLHGGPVLFAESSLLSTGPALGLDVLYHFTPRLSVGPSVGYMYTETEAEHFVAAVQLGADSSRIYQVGQQVSALTYALAGRFDVAPNGRLAPYISAGIGGYSLYLDSQLNNEPRRVGGPMFQVGGGVGFALSNAAGVSLDVRDIAFMDYDQEELNPIRPEHRNCSSTNTLCFPGSNTATPENKSMVHNIRVALGFSYIPGLNR